MTGYTKGRRKENELLKYLEYHGFTGCRSSGSHGFWDVIVSPSTTTLIKQTLHIQCGIKSREEQTALMKVAANHHGLFAHALFHDRSEPSIRMFLTNSGYIPLSEFLQSYYCVKAEKYFDVIMRLNPKKQTSKPVER